MVFILIIIFLAGLACFLAPPLCPPGEFDYILIIGLMFLSLGLLGFFFLLPSPREEITNILEDKGINVVEVDMELSKVHIKFDDGIYSCDFIKLNRDTVLLDSKSECKKFEGESLVAK